MRVVLCHHCWTWVFPNVAHCPECKRVIALDEPDPTAEELGQRFGTALMCLGDVIWERPKLPSRGVFWGTTTGLLYWPLLVHQPNGSIVPLETAATRSSTWTSLFSLWRRTEAEPEQMPPQDEEPVSLPAEGELLGQSFLDTPGAAFFPRENVVRVTRRGRSWMIHRTIGRPLRLTVRSNPTTDKPAWKTFFQQDNWRLISKVT